MLTNSSRRRLLAYSTAVDWVRPQSCRPAGICIKTRPAPACQRLLSKTDKMMTYHTDINQILNASARILANCQNAR